MVKDFKTIWSARVVKYLCWLTGKMWQVNYFFFPPFIGTNWFPPHSFVPTPVLPSFHDLTSARKHVLLPIVGKFRMLFFSTIQTKHNSQSTTYCYLALRGALECDLSWLVLPWGKTSAPLKICLFWQNLHLSDKSFALDFVIVWQNVSRVQRGPITRQLLLCFLELFDKF